LKSYSRILLITVILFSCFSCKHIGLGDDHISPKVMQKVLLDINLAESYSVLKRDSLHRPGTKNIDSLSSYYKEIFNHYHITEQEFKESMEWYKNNPDQLDSIYNNNSQIIAKWQAQVPTSASKVDSVKMKNEVTLKGDSLARKNAVIPQPVTVKTVTAVVKKPAAHKKKKTHHATAPAVAPAP